MRFPLCYMVMVSTITVGTNNGSLCMQVPMLCPIIPHHASDSSSQLDYARVISTPIIIIIIIMHVSKASRYGPEIS